MQQGHGVMFSQENFGLYIIVNSLTFSRPTPAAHLAALTDATVYTRLARPFCLITTA